MLDNDELFAVASDTPKTLAMPELATIWDGPQNLVSTFEGETAAAKTKLQSALRPEVRSRMRTEERLEVRPEVRAAVDTKPQQGQFQVSQWSQCSFLYISQVLMSASRG